MHCGGCGCEEYHIKFEVTSEADAWAECAECGRPTGVFGIGERKKRAWEREHG